MNSSIAAATTSASGGTPRTARSPFRSTPAATGSTARRPSRTTAMQFVPFSGLTAAAGSASDTVRAKTTVASRIMPGARSSVFGTAMRISNVRVAGFTDGDL